MCPLLEYNLEDTYLRTFQMPVHKHTINWNIVNELFSYVYIIQLVYEISLQLFLCLKFKLL